MDRRLAVLSVVTAGVVALAAHAPWAAVLAGLLIPVTALSGAMRGGVRIWALALAPAAGVLGFTGAEELGSFLAGALAGPIAIEAWRRGKSPAAALAFGAVPYALWAVGLAGTGFDPFPPEAEEALTGLLVESVERGDIPAERMVELRETTSAALGVVRRTWVASEATWFWITLVAAWMMARRVYGGASFGSLGRFSRFDVPDGIVGVLIAGMVMTLIPGDGWPQGLRTAGWNLVSGTGFIWAVRGIAIEWYWMERGGWRLPMRVAFLAGGVVLFLPAFLAATSALGLFDTWFDFRRVRTSEEGGNPFSFHHPSSEDDFPGKE